MQNRKNKYFFLQYFYKIGDDKLIVGTRGSQLALV